MKRLVTGLLALCLIALLAIPAHAALPAGTGMITDCNAVSGSEFTHKSSLAKKLDKMFAGDIGLYKDAKKTKLVNAALGTRNVPNNDVWQYWGPKPRAGTSCFAYANAFYCTFYDGVYPHHEINSNHQKIKATGKITYENFVKWGVRDDAVVYIREGNHSIVVLHYDKNYITYADGNGDARGLIAIRKEAWQRGSGANIYNQKPSLIVQPTKAYFPEGSLQRKPCTEGGTYHDWDQGRITKAATCKETGSKTRTCLACGKTKEETVAKTNDHNYGQWSLAKEPTCDKKGAKLFTCLICGKEKTEAIKALGHSYGKAVTVQEPTIYRAGVQEKICSQCGKAEQSKTQCAFHEETLGITLTTQEGVFPENTELLITSPEESTLEHDAIGLALQEVTGKFFPYVPDARGQGETVEPTGKFTVTIAIPQGFGANLALYAVEGEAAQALEGIFDPQNNTLTVELERLHTLALCDLDVPWVPEPTEATEIVTQPETQPVTEPATQLTVAATAEAEQTQKRMHMYIVLSAAAAVLLVGVSVIVAVVIVKKRKKVKIPEEIPEKLPEEEIPEELSEEELEALLKELPEELSEESPEELHV